MRSIPLIASGAFALLTATAPALAFEPIVVIGGTVPPLKSSGQEILATALQSDGEFGISTVTDTEAGSGPGMVVQESRSELWFVLEGEYTIVVDGKTYEGGPGTLMVADAGTPHQITSKGPGRLLMMWMPGGFEQFFVDWEEQGLEFGPELGTLEATYGVTRP